jgi:hypothetical protein
MTGFVITVELSAFLLQGNSVSRDLRVDGQFSVAR